MNTGPLAGDWLRLVAVLGLELGLVTMAFALLQRFCVSAVGRRLLWRAALMGTIAVLVGELAGAGQWMSHLLSHVSNKPKAVATVSANLDPSPELTLLPLRPLEPSVLLVEQPAPALADSGNAPSPVWWPAWLWLGGTCILLGRMLLAYLVFAIGLRRRGRSCDAHVGSRVAELARLLVLGRPVRLCELNDLAAPISYGVFRPGIVVPADFSRNNDEASRDAMVLHELAHVSARDGLWHAVGDLIVAGLWWHPAVWWMRREMESACEMAADEASVVVDNGPRVLAECLVTMAGRLAAPVGLGWQGIQGSRFRSRVGRRVERLLGLTPTLRIQANGPRRWAERTAVALLLVGIIVAGTLVGHERTNGPKSWRESWSGSLGAMVLSQIAAAEPKPVQGIDWIGWSRDAVTDARAQGRPVLVYFTADWALSAKVNEKSVLESAVVRERLAALNVAAVKADWTTPDDPSIETELKTFGGGTVPLTLIYSPDQAQAPEVLPEILTETIVLAALDRVQAISARLTTKAENSIQSGPASTPQQVSTLLFEGKSLFDAGRLDEARTKLQEALKTDPSNQAARHYLSRIDEMQRPAKPNSPTLQTRLFKIDKVAFAEGLIRRFPRTASETNVLTHKAVYERFSRYLKESGIEVGQDPFPILGPLHKPAPPGSTISPESDFLPRTGPVISENQKLGSFMLQATPSELDRVEQAIHALSAPLPQVLIEARLCEVPEDAWSLLQSNADIHLTPGNAVGGNNGGSNAIAQTCVLTPQQFAALEVGLREQSGVNVLSAPRVTTLSHRQAQIKIVDVRSVVTHLAPAMELSDAIRGTGGRGVVGGAGGQGGQGGVGGQGGKGGQGGVGGQGGGKGGVGQGGGGGQGGVGGAGGQRGGEGGGGAGGQGGKGGGQGGVGGQGGGQGGVGQGGAGGQGGGGGAGGQRGGQGGAGGGQGGKGGQGGQGGVGGQGGGGGGQGGRGGGGGGGRGGGRSNLVPIAEEFESGPVLDVIPYVRPDGAAIDLTVVATVKEFIGYDLDSPRFIDGVSPRPANLSHSPSVPPIIGPELSREKARFPLQPSMQSTPKPVYRLRQMMAPIRISDGQTAVLAGGEDKLDLVRSKAASAPLLSDLPVIGRLFRDEHAKMQKTRLVVLVTARIVDAAGNPIRSAEEVSSETPSQPERRLN